MEKYVSKCDTVKALNERQKPNEDTKKITSGMISYLQDLKKIHSV